MANPTPEENLKTWQEEVVNSTNEMGRLLRALLGTKVQIYDDVTADITDDKKASIRAKWNKMAADHIASVNKIKP